MIYKKIYNKKLVNFSILLLILIISIFFQSSFIKNQFRDQNDNDDNILKGDNLQSSETDYYTTEWIKYGNFSTGATSYWNDEIIGDSSDIQMEINSEEAQYKIIGEKYTKQFFDPINSSSASNWIAFNKTTPAINPDTFTINNGGFYVSHSWHDATPDQFTTISWRYNLSMGTDMSEYVITDAFIDTIMNATVNRNVDTPKDIYARYSTDYLIDQGGIFDHAIFYVELADMQLTTTYRVLYNKTNDLGQSDVTPNILSYSDKSIEQVGDEQDLIYYITSLFDKDPGHDELAIIVGIDIECEDDYTGNDYDDWNALTVKSVNLTMSYEKKIDKLTKASWNQDGNVIPSNYLIENATLNFRYKIDKDWATNTGSINSEFRIIINNNQLGETVKLTSATTTYKDFKSGGLDISSFLSPDEEVNLSIQIYFGDEFKLNNNITISIDNVTLIIGYGIFTPPDTSSYDLILNDINRTVEKSTQVTYNENLNITFIYKNSTGDFILDANVQLTGGGLSPITLFEDLTNNQYYTIIDSADLGVGTSYLILTASKRYHTSEEFQITVNVVNRDTALQLYLNGANETDNKEVSIEWNENLNITVKYLDIEQGGSIHINNALLELTGAGNTKTLSEDFPNEHYEILINTNILGTGVSYLTVYASKQNYSSLNIRFKVTVSSRDTYLDNILLDGNPSTSLEIQWNEVFDISVSYNDTLNNNFISGATVQLIGPSYNKTLSQFGQIAYISSINSNNFTTGNNFLTILAQKDNYSIASQLITIQVTERTTSITIELDETVTTAISVPYNEELNITTVYKDASEVFIDNALVELRNGSITLHTLLKHPIYNQYNLTINTGELISGVNMLSIYAKKDNFSAALVSIIISVSSRDTTLEVLLDGDNSLNFEFYNISVNEYLNITAIYNDYTSVFIDNAIVQLAGSGNVWSFTPHDTYVQYNLTLKVEDLGIGVHFLVISAEKENYTSSIVNIKLNVLERKASLQLYVDNNNLTISRYISSEIDRILNITVLFRDFTDSSHISSANVRLTGALNEDFTENLFYDYYNLSINSNDLGQGINFLTIFAQKAGYKSESILFTIEIVEKDSNYQIFLNDENKTLDKSIEVTIGEFINITLIYEDYMGLFIEDAEVIIVGEGISMNLSKNIVYDQYNVSLNSNDLNFGINLLTLYAQKINYQPQTLIVRIEIIEKDTDIHIFLNDLNKTIDRTLTIPIRRLLNITINYFDIENGTAISGAIIQAVGEGLLLNLTENMVNHQYSLIINTSQLDLGVRFLTIYCQRANYQSYSALLRIQVDRINTNISTYEGETLFNFNPGDNFLLRINLTDLDFGVSVLNAIVTYTWDYGQGTLIDPENDGIYEGTIPNLREGTFLITISVYAGDDYDFERFTITMTISTPPESALLYQILTIVGIAAAIGVSGYLLAYQKVLKYPKQVRKIHKVKSKLKKPKALGADVKSREQLINEHYSEEIDALEKQVKKKIALKTEQPSNDTLYKSENLKSNQD